MKALLYKDFIGIRKTFILSLLAIFAVSIVFVARDITPMISMMFIILPFIVQVTLFTLDDSCHFDRFALSATVPRKQVPAARYVFSLILILFSSIAMFVTIAFTQGLTISAVLLFAVAFFIPTLFVSIELPILYRFGAQNARYILMGLYFFIFFGATFLSKHIPQILTFFHKFLEAPQLLIAALLLLVTAGCFLLSYFISAQMYEKKEF
ncbi:MAG: ABC-2 transporter permease [Ndongobacter sp.]|nr:ABC-2 transporter permease [Ndongobacter sp.]